MGLVLCNILSAQKKIPAQEPLKLFVMLVTFTKKENLQHWEYSEAYKTNKLGVCNLYVSGLEYWLVLLQTQQWNNLTAFQVTGIPFQEKHYSLALKEGLEKVF